MFLTILTYVLHTFIEQFSSRILRNLSYKEINGKQLRHARPFDLFGLFIIQTSLVEPKGKANEQNITPHLILPLCNYRNLPLFSDAYIKMSIAKTGGVQSI
jgi:hypothetical protein